MRAPCGTIGLVAPDIALQDAPRQRELWALYERFASLTGQRPEDVALMAERVKASAEAAKIECGARGHVRCSWFIWHMRCSWFIMGDPTDRRDVCARCGDRIEDG